MDAKQLSRLFSKAKEFAKERGYNYIRYKCQVLCSLGI